MSEAINLKWNHDLLKTLCKHPERNVYLWLCMMSVALRISLSKTSVTISDQKFHIPKCSGSRYICRWRTFSLRHYKQYSWIFLNFGHWHCEYTLYNIQHRHLRTCVQCSYSDCTYVAMYEYISYQSQTGFKKRVYSVAHKAMHIDKLLILK
jgi:hypothetical protein